MSCIKGRGTASRALPRWLWLFIALWALCPLAAAASLNYSDPWLLVSQVSENLFGRLDDEQRQIRARPQLLREIIDEEVVPAVDYRYAAYKIMGQQARGSTREQRDAFVVNFREYMVTGYAQLFTRYDKNRHSYRITPRSSRTLAPDQVFTTVRVLLIERGQPDIPVDFRLRKNRKTGQWRAYDMVTEGISFLDSKSTEFQGMIRRKGLDVVTEEMAQKSRQPIRFEDGNS